jgi:DNA repair protein RadC
MSQGAIPCPICVFSREVCVESESRDERQQKDVVRAGAERPRERLLTTGSEVLSDAELVSIVLGTGGRGVPALALARQILSDCGGLAGLVGAAPAAVRRPGVGPAKTASLLAVIELARRLARTEVPRRDPLSHPHAVAEYLRLRYSRKEQEIMGALFLDSRNRLVAEREIFRGTLSRAAVEPRAILKRALLQDAAGLILFHTHPSGDPTPSAEDVAFTRRMVSAGDVVGVRLVDHLVVGACGRWVSLRRMGEC